MVFDLGAAVGVQPSSNGPVEFLPSIALQYAGTHLSGTSTFGGVARTFRAGIRTYGVTTVNFGVLMAQRVTVTPFYHVSFGAGGPAIGTGGLALSLNLGAPKH
jgi:hypothetical protein